MYKQCRTCGSQVPLDAKFCQTCGNSDFIVPNQQAPYMNNPMDNQPNYNYGQNSYGQANTGNQTSWQPATPQENSKKKKNGLIVGVVVAVILVLAGIGYAAQEAWQDMDNDEYYGIEDDYNFDEVFSEPDYSEDIVINDDVINGVGYTKGTFDGTVYENEWADIKIKLPEGFHNSDPDSFLSSNDPDVECGLFFIANDSTSLFSICFEKLSSYSSIDTAEEYLEVALDNFESDPNYTYIISNAHSTVYLAGYEYVRGECQMNNGNNDVVTTIYIRKIDDYIVFITVNSIKGECDNDKLIRDVFNMNSY